MNLPQRIKILLVDDHHIFNDGLKRLIDEQPDFRVCGQVFSARDLFYIVESQRPDLVLMDVNLQGVNGIDLGKKVLDTYPKIKIMVLTMYNQFKLLEETRKTGLHGYLLKDAPTPELLLALRTVLNGKFYFDSKVTQSLQHTEDAFGDDFANRLNLTFREVEIISLIRKGFTNEEIADQLHLSFFTVKTHRKNIHFKLGLKNVAELISFAARYDL